MKAALILSVVTILGMGGTYLAQEPAPVVIIQQDETITPLERARRATFLLSLPGYRFYGSAILVGRQHLDNGKYRYRALTAYHVIKDMSKAFMKDRTRADHRLALIFQPNFHGKTLRINLLIDDIDWANPAVDWASITFDMSHKMSCVEVATREEFEAIKAFEKIYAIGCGGGYGQMCKVGVIGATHNEHKDLQGQTTLSKWPWNLHPEKFFRPYVNVWYGDSGGGIFNKEGKLIGIMNAFGILNKGLDRMPVVNKDFFKIED